MYMLKMDKIENKETIVKYTPASQQSEFIQEGFWGALCVDILSLNFKDLAKEIRKYSPKINNELYDKEKLCQLSCELFKYLTKSQSTRLDIFFADLSYNITLQLFDPDLYDPDILRKLEIMQEYISYCATNDSKELYNSSVFTYYAMQNQVINGLPKHTIDIKLKINEFDNSYFFSHYKEIAEDINKEYNRVFSCEDIVTLCFISVLEILSSGCKIRKCNNCGNFFVALYRSDTIYCDRTSPQDKSKNCKEYGIYQTWRKKESNSISRKLYHSIYSAKQMYVKRNPDIPLYLENFVKWKDEAKAWKQEVKNGNKTEDDFIEWLKYSRNAK